MRPALAGVLCCVLLSVQGCAHRQVNELAGGLPVAGPEDTLRQLEKLKLPSRDRVQYLLDRGMLKMYAGDFSGSRADLEQAKGIMQSLQASSITENLAAVTTNETLRAFSGAPSDRVLVHLMLALDYLFDNDLDGARVEMLQADVTMQELANSDSVVGQLASVRFVAGLVYELNQEWDDALISYRRAYEIMLARAEPIPPALQSSLLNLTKQLGLIDEYDAYVARFGREQHLPGPDEGEWILLYFDGVVSSKTERRYPVFDPGLRLTATVVIPGYGPASYSPRSLDLQSAGREQSTAVLENLEHRTREDLEEAMPGIMAAATARAVGKLAAVKSTQDHNNGLASVLVMVAALASEQADLRSWNMLPASIQVARLVAPLSETATISSKGFVSSPLEETGARGLAVLFATSISNRVYSYPGYRVPTS